MIKPILGRHGAVVAPNSLAAQAGLDILREGGNAIEANIAIAATLAVVYPHMTGIGGDGFWLIHEPGQAMRAIDACGASASAINFEYYAGQSSIPWRGPTAANTVAGTLSGWALAYEHSKAHWGGKLPFSRLLESAVNYARFGYPVTHSQMNNTRNKLGELKDLTGFSQTFLKNGQVPDYGDRFDFPMLADTLEQIGKVGPMDFYQGDLAQTIAQDLEQVGSPVTLQDLRNHCAQWKTPLQLELSCGRIFNMTPPTQGLASLMILGVYDRVREPEGTVDSLNGVHRLVESTKQAFIQRDQWVTDPAHMPVEAQSLLTAGRLDHMASHVPLNKASPWPAPISDGDTTWMGVIDSQGRAVSMIQSIYFEFGSGVVLPRLGFVWQNRGCSFDLTPGRIRSLAPNKKPFHTLNPAMAQLNAGRLLVYGTMGGEGQPQTQAAVFSRYVWSGHNVRTAVAAPRWLLGRTWAEQSTTLKVEAGLGDTLIQGLRDLGHPVEVIGDLDERMGHAGALVLHPNGLIEGGEDPRSDGCVAAF